MEIFTGLLSSKLFWSILGPLTAAIILYYKGYKAGTRNSEEEREFAKRALDARIRAAEAKNQHIEKEASKIHEKLNRDSQSIDSLIRVFDEIQRGQDSSPDAPKDPK